MTRVHACLECGAQVPFGNGVEFCSPGCRHAWNNRRKARGALLLDLYMAHRFDRAEATDLGVLAAMNRLAGDFRDEDREKRGGRRSWRPARTVLAERPYLRAKRGDMRIRGRV